MNGRALAPELANVFDDQETLEWKPYAWNLSCLFKKWAETYAVVAKEAATALTPGAYAAFVASRETISRANLHVGKGIESQIGGILMAHIQ